jgi:hypothetical protein
MNTALFDFPTIVSASLLSSWLDARALCQLDSACASKCIRPALLKIFSCEGFKAKYINKQVFEGRRDHPNAFVRWLKLRSLSTERLQLTELSVEALPHLDRTTCRRLKSLSVGTVSVRALSHVLASASLLQCFVIQELTKAPKALEPAEPVTGSALCAPLLTELTICRTIKLNSDLVELLDGRKLETLILRECAEVSKSFMQNLAEKVQPDRFRTLQLENLPTLTDTRLARLLRNASGLRTLSIRNCPEISSETYETLSTYCTALQYLFIGRLASDNAMDGSDESSFVALTLICTELKELAFYNIQGMTDVSLKAILQNALRVETLIIVGCNDIKGEGRVTLAYQQLPALHTLRVENCSYLTGLLNICEICPHLRNLQVRDCYDLTYAACTQVFRYGTRLEKLCLRDCSLLYGYDLDAIPAGNLPLLVDLDLSACFHLVDEGIESIVAICPNLQTLQLAHTYGLTARALQAIALDCHKLRSFSIKTSSCTSQSALLNVLENSNIQALNVSWQEATHCTSHSAGITADTLLSMAVLPMAPLQLSVLSIHRFLPTGPNISAMTTLLDAYTALHTLYLSCGEPEEIIGIDALSRARLRSSVEEHFSAYVQLLRRVYARLTIHIVSGEGREDDF